MMKDQIKHEMKQITKKIEKLPQEGQIEILNMIYQQLSQITPFKEEPVSCLQWIPMEKVIGNDYNPNKVAPPEMQLLHLSIKADGYTQPIVAYYDKDLEQYIIVDGFHRNRVGKEYEDIRSRLKGYLPIVVINKTIEERMASTVRHNRARGTHEVAGMAQLVAELHLKGVSDKKIGEQLGMEKDEVLRLKQFTGLGNLFKHREFSKAWI